MPIKYPSVTLYCLHCQSKLRTLALEDQLKDGRILCTHCRMSEAGRLYEPEAPEGWWWEFASILALCGLAWAALYFLG